VGTCDGKVVLVTGASRGLGKGIAKMFAAEGATVAMAARTVEPVEGYIGSLQETREEIEAAGGKAVTVQADLSAADTRAAMFEAVVAATGAPDILINNAAVTFLRALDEFPEKRAKLMLEMHVLAPLQLTQLAIPAMRERGAGWVLNLTSMAGERIPGPPFDPFDVGAGFGMYGTVKAALSRLTQSFAAELHADNIAVNAVAPFKPVATEGAATLDLAKEDTEDISLTLECVKYLCTGDPQQFTGIIAQTQPFLQSLGKL